MASKQAKDQKRIPLEVSAVLRVLSEDELTYMISVAGGKDFETFITVTRKLIDRNMSLVFAYPEAEPQKLAIFKANARGQVGGLANLIYMFKGAEAELKRRSEKK